MSTMDKYSQHSYIKQLLDIQQHKSWVMLLEYSNQA